MHLSFHVVSVFLYMVFLAGNQPSRTRTVSFRSKSFRTQKVKTIRFIDPRQWHSVHSAIFCGKQQLQSSLSLKRRREGTHRMMGELSKNIDVFSVLNVCHREISISTGINMTLTLDKK